MSVKRLSFVVGLVVGLCVVMVVPAQAGPTQAVHKMAEAAWPYLDADQRSLIDLMARDLYRETTTAAQKKRISGQTDGRYESLPEWRKAPFRGMALRQLGHTAEDFSHKAV